MREKIINNRQNILLGIIIIILALWNILNTNGIKTDVKSYREKIENIQSEVDSAQLVNKEMDEKVLVIKETVNLITKEIHEIDNNIEMVKEQTDEKVISVGFIGNAELERLFTDRYSN
jgi:peptidoglycan hydrolase CwlO-like protein